MAQLRRPAVGMALGTTASRTTGLLRTVALAAAVGVGTTSDAYNLANTAPNMLFALAAGGILGSALVPMLARDDPNLDRREVASVLLGTITLWTAGIAVVTLVGSPILIRALAAGADQRPDAQRLIELGENWLRWFAPQIPLYGVSVVATGVMTAHRRLALGAAAPVATNVFTILAAILFIALAGSGSSPTGNQVIVLGFGTTAAVGAMAAIQLWGARRTEPGLRFSPRLRHPAVRELRQLAGWMLLYVIVNQLALGAVMAMASAEAGAITGYQWAFMLMQLPYAVVAVSIFSSAYPLLARVASQRDDLTSELIGPGVRATALLLPAAIGLASAAAPLTALVVGPSEADLVAAGVRGFAISLVPFSIFQLLTRAHYVRKDTRTPALVNIAVNATMLAVNALALAMSESPATLVFGLAAGHAISYIVGCVLLGAHLARKGALRTTTAGLGPLPRLVVASTCTASVLWFLPMGMPQSRWGALGAIALAATVGAVTYAVTAGRPLRRLLLPGVDRRLRAG